MNKNTCLIFLLFASMLLNFLAVEPVLAEEAASEKLAVSLVVDTSGSMKKTDPEHLRETASNIFIDLLSPEDYVGVVTFDSDASTVFPIEEVKSTENKKELKKELAPSLEATNGDTNYLAALEAANSQLDDFEKAGYRKVIIFLTDGVPDPDPEKAEDEVFMEAYLQEMWDIVSSTSMKGYPIYSVGFGDVNPDVLNRISEETLGEAMFVNEPEQLAVTFFDILSTLKNRQSFLEKNDNYSADQEIEFDIDSSTSQVNMALTYSDPNIEIDLIAPEEGMNQSDVTIEKNEQYAILTLNQQSEELAGKWQLNLKGEGKAEIFGDKDLYLKTWIEKPQRNSQHPINEPMDINVRLTGEIREGVSVEAHVTKNGKPEVSPLLLKKSGDLYTGVYENVDVQGTYEVTIIVKQQDQSISTTSSFLTVKDLPVLVSDFYTDNSQFKAGESALVTGSLELKGNRINSSQNVSIEAFSLRLLHESGEVESFDLLDDGNAGLGDLKAEDGTYSSNILFETAETVHASLVVQGNYKGENFLLEKDFGTITVNPPGTIRSEIVSAGFLATAGSVLEIPVSIENVSNYEEILYLTLDTPLGQMDKQEIILKPQEETKEVIVLNVDPNMNNGIHDLQLTLSAEDPLTSVATSTLIVPVEIVSETQFAIRKLLQNLPIFAGVVAVVLAVPALGIFLYQKRVQPKMVVSGNIQYWKENKNVEKAPLNEWLLTEKKQQRIEIAFGDGNTKADYVIENSNYAYSLIIENPIQHTFKEKMIEGYKSLRFRPEYPSITIQVTMPGVFTVNGSVYSSKVLSDNDILYSGGYVFHYHAVQDTEQEKEVGQNLLEDKV